jgi:pSer/pThr/pTyr-binding forkhead associated (FHA) protein
MSFKNFWIQYKVNNLPYESQILKERFTIGRSPDCDLTIVSEVVSRKHLKVEFVDEKIIIQDLGSTNGTFIDGELLKPHEKYEYKTNNNLYIDVKKQVVLRIIVLSVKAPVDIELDLQKLKLEKKKQELKSKSKNFSQKDDFINNATEKVDNLFENILFVAKSARFNKEKAIKEAEYQSVELLENAKKEIEKDRNDFESQLKALQEETINEAKRTINSAHAKSKKIISQAEEEARELAKKIEADKAIAMEELENQKQKIINQAQEKHSEIIGEAYLKNKELKEENVKLQNDIFENKQLAQAAKKDIQQFIAERNNFEQSYNKAKLAYDDELVTLNALKSRVAQQEARNNEVLKVLNVEIPEKETHLEALKEDILVSKNQYKIESTQLEQIQDDIARHQDQLKKDEDRSNRAEQRLDELSDKLMEAEDNLFKLNKIKQHRIEEIDKEIAERKERYRIEEEKQNAALSSHKAKTKKEIEVNLAKAKELAANLIKDANSDVKQILDKAKVEAELLSVEIKRESEELKKSALLEVKELRDLAKKETQELRDKTKKEADELQQKTKKETDEIKNNLKEYIDREKQQVIDEAKLIAKNLIDKAEDEKKTLLDKFHATEKKMYEELSAELDEKKKNADQEIQSIRSNAVNSIDEQRRNLLREEEIKTNIRVMRLRKELNDVLRARINPFLKEASHLEKVSLILEKSINAIMLDEVDSDFSESENYSDFDPSLQQNKVKKFWKYTSLSVLLGFLFVIFMPDFKKVAVDASRNIAAKADQDTKTQIEQAQKINDLSKEFHPEIVEEYLDSYTDRVLYTRDYVETELEKKYREQWIIDLQEYFVNTLRLDENKLVPFIAQEANLIRELEDAKKLINGNFIKEGIAKMREIEASFIKKIRENIKAKKNFDKIMNFKKEFFLKNRKALE